MSHSHSLRTLGLGLAPAAALVAAMAAPALAQVSGSPSVNAFGFAPSAEGAATLSTLAQPNGDLRLTVSNIGSSGLDGVRFAIGGDGADGFAARGVAPTTDDGGETLVWTVSGEVNGGPEGTLGTLSLENVLDPVLGSRWHLSSDNSALGLGGSYTLRAKDGARTTLELSGLTSADEIVLETLPGSVAYLDNLGSSGKDGVAWTVTFDTAMQLFSIDRAIGSSGYDIQATALELVPENTGALQTMTVTHAEGHFADTGDVVISGAGLNVFDQWISGNGEAQVYKLGTQVDVVYLGSSGCDGQSIVGGGDGGGGEGSSTSKISGTFAPLDAAGTLQAGAQCFVMLDAVVEGEPHEDFMAMTFTKGPPGNLDRATLSCDPDMLQAWWDYEYCLAGAVVSSGQMANQLFEIDKCFDTQLTVEASTDPAGGELLSVQFATATTASVDGNPFTIDEVRLRLSAADAVFVSDKIQLSVDVNAGPGLTCLAMATEATPQLSMGAGHGFRGHVTILKWSLTGGGPLTGGSLNGVSLADAPESSLCGLFLGFAATPTPFKKGLLVPVPVAELFILQTDANGKVNIPFAWPQGIPAGIPTYAQFVVNQVGPPPLIWFSNALELNSQ